MQLRPFVSEPVGTSGLIEMWPSSSVMTIEHSVFSMLPLAALLGERSRLDRLSIGCGVWRRNP